MSSNAPRATTRAARRGPGVIDREVRRKPAITSRRRAPEGRKEGTAKLALPRRRPAPRARARRRARPLRLFAPISDRFERAIIVMNGAHRLLALGALRAATRRATRPIDSYLQKETNPLT